MSSEDLPSLDRDFLKSKGYTYEVLTHNGILHVIISDFPVPSNHYNVSSTEMLIQIPQGYPNAKLDMFWTYPIITLRNGASPVTTQHREEFHGKTWQRWSRHGEWRPGVDSLKTYIQAIHRELAKGR